VETLVPLLVFVSTPFSLLEESTIQATALPWALNSGFSGAGAESVIVVTVAYCYRQYSACSAPSCYHNGAETIEHSVGADLEK
jgi:hypothetical protein